jgi:hypothetical protein
MAARLLIMGSGKKSNRLFMNWRVQEIVEFVEQFISKNLPLNIDM